MAPGSEQTNHLHVDPHRHIHNHTYDSNVTLLTTQPPIRSATARAPTTAGATPTRSASVRRASWASTARPVCAFRNACTAAIARHRASAPVRPAIRAPTARAVSTHWQNKTKHRAQKITTVSLLTHIPLGVFDIQIRFEMAIAVLQPTLITSVRAR